MGRNDANYNLMNMMRWVIRTHIAQIQSSNVELYAFKNALIKAYDEMVEDGEIEYKLSMPWEDD